VSTRTDRKTLTFEHPFRLKGIDRTLPAGTYQVITDEELIEGLSFFGLPKPVDDDGGAW